MNHSSPLHRRARLTVGARMALAVLFLIFGATPILASVEPRWVAYVFFLLALAGLLIVAFWNATSAAQEEGDELIEIARGALASEARRLDTKKRDLEKLILTYGEWLESPDYAALEKTDWFDESHLALDGRVSRLLDQESDLMLKRFGSGAYWTDGRFDGKQLLLDLISFVESIARIYQPDSPRPLLEMNFEKLLKAINRASLQIILLLEEIPMLKLQEMSLRKMTDHIRNAAKVYRKIDELNPIFQSMRYLGHGGKVLLAANPLLAAGWIAGTELIWRGGKAFGSRLAESYLLSLVRQALGIIAGETVGLYDRSHRYRNPEWIYGVELAHLLSKFDATQAVLREAFRELSRLPLHSTYDRVFLYRCIAHNISPKPELFASTEIFSEEVRKQLFDKLVKFFDRNIKSKEGLDNKQTHHWRDSLRGRLGV
jgi:hypothetical protein